MKGWIKIHRRLINWQHYGNPNVSRVFLHLILTANYEDGKTDKGIEVKRGQLVVSLNGLADTLGISVAAIRHALKTLQQSGEVKILTYDRRFTIVTVSEYSTFQGVISDKNNDTDNDTDNDTNNDTNYDTDKGTDKGTDNTPTKVSGLTSSKGCSRTNDTDKGTDKGTDNDTDNNTDNNTDNDTPFIRNKEVKEIKEDKEDKELKNIHTQQNSVATPKVVAPGTVDFKNSSESLNTPPEGKEKKKVPRKRKENPVLLAKGAEFLPKGSKENNYVNYAIYFHRLLEPVHGGKYTFDHANAYKWAKDIKTLLEKHKRGLQELFDLVKWVVDHSDDSLVYMQSPSFLTKNDGINYDRLLSKREFEQKRIDKLNGKAPTKIKAVKYLN